MSEEGNDFKTFLTYFFIFAFIMLFWDGFKTDMIKKNGNINIVNNNVKYVQQKVYTNREVRLSSVYLKSGN